MVQFWAHNSHIGTHQSLDVGVLIRIFDDTYGKYILNIGSTSTVDTYINTTIIFVLLALYLLKDSYNFNANIGKLYVNKLISFSVVNDNVFNYCVIFGLYLTYFA